MKKRVHLLLLVMTILFFISTVSAIVLTVDDDLPADFTTIQDAIDFASDGDVIEVGGGTYSPFVVDKRLDIKATGVAVVDAKGNASGVAIIIEADNVIINGLIIEGDIDTYAGIIVTPGSNNTVIKDNEIFGMKKPSPSNLFSTYGILVWGNNVTPDPIPASTNWDEACGDQHPPFNTTISNNKIHDLRLFAISLGDCTENTIIINNDIHDIFPVELAGIPLAMGIQGRTTKNLVNDLNKFENVITAVNLGKFSNGVVNNDEFTNVTVKVSHVEGEPIIVTNVGNYAKTHFETILAPGDDFTGYFSILQDAINSASIGDVIFLANGTYIENLILDKEITIVGESNLSSIINGSHVITSDFVNLESLTFNPTSPVIIIDSTSSTISNITINNSIFELTTSSSVGIVLTGSMLISGIYILDNTFNGPSNMNCNPFKIGGSFGIPENVEVNELYFQRNNVNRCSTPINLQDKDLTNLFIFKNVYKNTDGAFYIWTQDGTTPTGVLNFFKFLENDIDSSNTYGLAFFDSDIVTSADVANDTFTDANFGLDITIEDNSFDNIPGGYGLGGVSFLGSFTSYILNAEKNWWGSCDGPRDVGNGTGSNVSLDVDFIPWIGTGISVSPINADGSNNWYVSIPEFTLFNYLNGGDILYQWDSVGINIYAGPFMLDGIPNSPPVESAGLLDLNFYNEFGTCNITNKQTKIFLVDVTPPEFNNFYPENNSIIYNNLRPTISVYLDDVYQGNSGIDIEIAALSLNGGVVVLVVNDSINQTGIDAVVNFIPTFDLPFGVNNVTINATDRAGHNSSLTWTFNITNLAALIMQIYSPLNKTYNVTKTKFNISLNIDAVILEYIDYEDKNPRWKTLCRNCNESGFTKFKARNLKNGPHFFSVRANDSIGSVTEKNVSFFIDSKKPRILKTFPTKGIIGSIFEIKFRELNPVNLTLHYWNNISGYNASTFDIENDCVVDVKKTEIQECDKEINLSEFDGMEIVYWVELIDIANNKVQSKNYTLTIDETDPIVNNPLDFFNQSGRFIFFNISITEMNFDEVYYIDENDPRLREKRLCLKLSVDDYCFKKISLKDGLHNLTIYVIDAVGHITMLSTGEFLVDTKVPRVLRTNPRRGLANGNFSVEVREDNPVNITFHVNDMTQDLDIDNNCTLAKGKYKCNTIINLLSLDSEIIEFWFSINDSVNLSIESRHIFLEVDALSPVLNNPLDYWVQTGRFINFNMNIIDNNFDSVKYKDLNVSNPRFRTLCNRLRDGFCEKKKSFKSGNHFLEIMIKDDAGNVFIAENVEFAV